MRCFIALEFDEKLKSKLWKIQQKIKCNSLKGSWVRKDNFHLTLKFLGEINFKCIDKIGFKLQEISFNYDSIPLCFSKLGVFKNKDKVRVVWIGIKGNINPLFKLNLEVQDEMSKLGFKKEHRKYKPHITLGRRVVFNNKLSYINTLLSKDLCKDFTFSKITLMKSEEIMGKRIYTPLKSYKLKKI